MATTFQTVDSTGIDINTQDDLIIMPGVNVTDTLDAIDILGSTAGIPTTIFNYGTIIGGLRAIDSAESLTLENHGIITSTDFRAIDLDGTDITAIIRNYGTITSDDELILTLFLDGTNNDIHLNNTGTMISHIGDILYDDASLRDVTVFNSGILHGRELSLGRTGHGYVFNSGEIRTTQVTKNFTGTGGTTIINHGIIAPTIAGQTTPLVLTSNSTVVGDEDLVINHGTIDGDVWLQAGDDQYLAYGTGVTTGMVDGGNGNDTLRGADGDDYLQGGNDDDLVVGNGGNDLLFGGAGQNTLMGGDGADTLNGGGNEDTLLGGDGDDLVDGSTGQDLLIGGAGSDTLLGGSDDDRLLGGAGEDSMDGGLGNDTLSGNDGDDTLFGNTGNDMLAGQAGADDLNGGDGIDTLDGGSGNDTLEGDAGNDILRGRNGEDELAGGLGRDFLTGGEGADIFVFRTIGETLVGANRDQILDFEQGVDLITVAGLSPGVFEFRGTAGFAPSGNPELRLFETPTGSTIVQMDANGDGTPDAEIRVANVTGLTAEDFTL